jgi:hypothetical protein
MTGEGQVFSKSLSTHATHDESLLFAELRGARARERDRTGYSISRRRARISRKLTAWGTFPLPCIFKKKKNFIEEIFLQSAKDIENCLMASLEDCSLR